MTMRYVNDVTPTTEDIKAAWFYNIGVEPDDIDVDPAVIAGWDNWLASVKAEAWDEACDHLEIECDHNPYREAKNV